MRASQKNKKQTDVQAPPHSPPLPVFGIFNFCTGGDTFDHTQGLYDHRNNNKNKNKKGWGGGGLGGLQKGD